MITCKRCTFEVVETMRHSLIKNCCPSCGSALLGDLHMQRLRLLKQRVMEQSFSQELDEALVFDITLFMLTEFFPDRSTDEDQEVEEEVFDDQDNDVNKEVVEELSMDMEPAEEDYESIRSEVRSEMLSKIDVDIENSDLDMKVARLKRIAKEKAVAGTGPSVRRVTD